MSVKIEYKMSNIKGLAKKFPKPTASALNKMAKMSKTTASKSVRETYTIPKEEIDKTMSIRRATSLALYAVIVSRGAKLALTKFKARWKRKMAGAQVTIKKGEPKTLTHTFMATMPSGHIGVMSRVGLSRLPISQRVGPSASDLMSSRKVQGDVNKQIDLKFYDLLLHELNYYMNVRKGR